MTYDIISVGSTAVDLFLNCESNRVTFERSGDRICMPLGAKILIDQCCSAVGGSATNSSTSFKRLGLQAGVISKLGNDPYATLVLNHLKQEGIRFMGTQAPGNTGLSVIISGVKHDRTILVHKGNNNKLKKTDLPKRLNTRWFYFGSALEDTWATQKHLANYAKKNNIKILFNPSHYVAKQGIAKLKPVLSATNILILNKEEARALTNIRKEIPGLLKHLQEHVPIVVITNGAKGAHAYNGIAMHAIKPKDVPVTDPTGAGDAFASGFLASIIHGNDIPTALKWAAAQANNILGEYGTTNTLLTKQRITKKAKTAGKITEVPHAR